MAIEASASSCLCSVLTRTQALRSSSAALHARFSPRRGVVWDDALGGSAFEVIPLAAILDYAMIAWVRFKAVGLVMGDMRRDVRTISSQIDIRVSSAAIVNQKDTKKGGDTYAK